MFTKMPLMYNDSVKSLPVMIYEELEGASVTHRRGLTYINNRLAFNTVLPEFYYRVPDLRRERVGDKEANLFYLGELIQKPHFFEDYLEGKFIIIGDFAGDNHSTYLGSMPGALILLDSFLTLQQQAPVVSLTWLSLLWILFTGMSYFIIIHPEKKFKTLHEKVKFRFFKKTIIKYLSFIGLLVIADLVSLFIYSTFVSIFYLATYLTLLVIIIEKYQPFIRSLKKWGRKATPGAGLILILFLGLQLQAQVYSVSAVRGHVYWQGKLLKNGDLLQDPQTLSSEEPGSLIRLLNPKEGSILLSFSNCKPEQVKTGTRHSELYILTVQKYIRNYTANRVLTTKGDFDWARFFIDSCKGKMLLFENQALPLFPSVLHPDPGTIFRALIRDKDSSYAVELPVRNDSLLFPASLFPGGTFEWKLEIETKEGDNRTRSLVTDSLIRSNVMNTRELDQLLSNFTGDWQSCYRQAADVKNDIFTFLNVNYGVFYKGYLEPELDRLLALPGGPVIKK